MREFLGQNRIREIVHLARGKHVGAEREHQDWRIRGVRFAIARVAGQIGGQLAARCVDGGLNVAGGGVDVAIEIELESDGGAAELAGRSHLRDAGDAAELALERSGDSGGHGLRAGAGKIGVDDDRRKFDLRAAAQPATSGRPSLRRAASAAVSSDVATGRLMNGSERFMVTEVELKLHAGCSSPQWLQGWLASACAGLRLNAFGQTVKEQINDRRRVEGQHLADDQSADDGDAERPAQFRADAGSKASGTPPRSAAMVVIMMGRKRSRQAW